MATDNSHYFYSPRDADTRGNVFTKLFIDPTIGNTNFSINEATPDSIKNSELAYNIIIAKLYANKPNGINDNDIHPEFTDFIIETALYHRKINSSFFVEAVGKFIPQVYANIKSNKQSANEIINNMPDNSMANVFQTQKKQLKSVSGTPFTPGERIKPQTSDPLEAALRGRLAIINNEISGANDKSGGGYYDTPVAKQIKENIIKEVGNYVATNPNATLNDVIFNIINKGIIISPYELKTLANKSSNKDFYENVIVKKQESIAKLVSLQRFSGLDDSSGLGISVIDSLRTPINPSTDRVYADTVSFVNLLPKYSKTFMGNLYFTGISNNQQKVASVKKQYVNEDAFKNMYQDVYTYKLFGDVTYDDYIGIMNPKIEFDVIMDASLISQQTDIKIPPLWSIVNGEVVFADNNVWNTNLDTCYTTYIDPTVIPCLNVKQCIESTNEDKIRQCVALFSSKKNLSGLGYDDSLNINKIHPYVAMKILRMFGFQFANKQFMTVQKWLSDVVPDAFTTETSNNIISNTVLKDYLNKLVLYVNGNPGLFNTGPGKEIINGSLISSEGLVAETALKPETKPESGILSSFFPSAASTKVPTETVTLSRKQQESSSLTYPPKTPENIVTATSATGFPRPTVNNATRFAESAIPNEITRFMSPPTRRTDNLLFYPALWNLNLRGGFASNVIPIQTDGADLAKGYLDQLVSQLKAKGVTVDQTIVQNVQKQIADLKDLETKIVRTLEYITKYKDMLNVFGSNGTISQDKLEKVNDYFGKLEQKANKTNTSILDSMKSLMGQ